METIQNSFYHRHGKRWLDVVLACTALVLLTPVMLGVSLLVLMTMGRPVVFRQLRAGRDERTLTILKFRTMLVARGDKPLTEAERLTLTGRFLRATSLDELPQLWNIVKGEMSFIGPRPLPTSYLPFYTERETLRHRVRPGITGLAQVSGRNYLQWEDRLELDVKYVESMALRQDLRIFMQTAMKVVLRRDVTTVPGTGVPPLPDHRRQQMRSAA